MSQTTFCYNPKTNAITEWGGVAFMRIWRVGNVYFGIRPDGIYQLAGDHDGTTPIAASFTLAKNNLGTNALKRLPYMRIDTDASLTVTTSFDDNEEHSVNVTDHIIARRVKLGRGAHGRNISISFSAETAVNFVVRSFEAYPEIYTKGVK